MPMTEVARGVQGGNWGLELRPRAYPGGRMRESGLDGVKVLN